MKIEHCKYIMEVHFFLLGLQNVKNVNDISWERVVKININKTLLQTEAYV